MAGQICQRLIRKVWRSYAYDLENVPEDEGIYVIGLEEARDRVTYLYLGYSSNVHERLQEHKYQSLKIDEFIKEQFRKNDGTKLRIKWVLQPDSKLLEGACLHCIEQKVGYQLRYNIKRGNCYWLSLAESKFLLIFLLSYDTGTISVWFWSRKDWKRWNKDLIYEFYLYILAGQTCNNTQRLFW